MAEKKISELPIIETPSASALIPIVVDGNGVANTNAISASSLGGYIAGIVTGRTNTFTNTNTYLGTQIFNANIQTNSEIENVSTGIRVFNSLQSINNYTGSDSGVINRILQTTASLNTQTGSQNSVNLGISTFSGSIRSEVSGIEAYTASLKGVAIVSSSNQILNYNIVATTGSNTFVGNQTITGSLIVSGSSTFTNIGRTELTGSVEIDGDVGVYGNITVVQKTIEVLGFPTNQPAFYSEGDILLSGSLSIHVEELGESFDVAEQFQQAFSSISFTQGELEIISSSYATTGSNTFYGNQTISGSFNVSGSTVQSGNNTLTGNTILSGSISISGSTTFNGVHTLSGSNTIVGNTIMTGTNTIIGNTEMSGSIDVSGSSNFHNTIFIVTGSQFYTGSSDFKGNQTITGSLNVNGDINVASGSGFFYEGNKLFNRGQFYHTETLSGSANTAYPFQYNTTDTTVTNGTIYVENNSRVYVKHTGIYNIQFSSQLRAVTNDPINFSVWFAMTGSNVMNSNTDYTIEKVSGGGNMVAALNYLMPLPSGSYFEIYYSKTRTDGQIEAKGTQSTPTRPATPSVILTVTQIA